MIRDVEELIAHLQNTDPDWAPITLLGIGEMVGDRTTPVPNAGASWINLSPYETDEFGVPPCLRAPRRVSPRPRYVEHH